MAKQKYIAKTRIDYNSGAKGEEAQRVEAGEEIDVDDKHAKDLLAVGAIEPIAEKKADKKDK